MSSHRKFKVVTGPSGSGKTAMLSDELLIAHSEGKKCVGFVSSSERIFKRYKLRANVRNVPEIPVYELNQTSYNTHFLPESKEDILPLDFDFIAIDDFHSLHYSTMMHRIMNTLMHNLALRSNVDVIIAGYKFNPFYLYTGTKRMTLPGMNEAIALSNEVVDLSYMGKCDDSGNTNVKISHTIYFGGDRDKKESYKNVGLNCVCQHLWQRKGIGD